MLPKLNQMLHYQIASSDAEEAAIAYKSRIADELEDGFLIEMPISEKTGRYKRLFLGDELSMYFVSEDGIKNYFDSHVTGFKEDGIRLVKIRKPDPDRIAKVQRRSFLRVGAELDLAVKLSSHVRFVCKTDDVGGGGISFVCDGKWPLEQGQTLECWLLLSYRNGSIEHAPFKGEIVRVAELDIGRKQAMIKFVSINDSERQKIIRYCFEKQLETRNR
ncbi:flagellar brake protein [Paenibacillus arenilitoris]|uniref:Flagellar brake domain-containing protein n=1 Tax=Paenibacillus arenilitoris TaxID=2772299 RepID=A0A927CP10_9BACL|nr:flagellar brake domain-containing protein [Paenibacillus arenilitoris]MBD2869631.1 flagellar brake domain-containing protein [Paenibacillus arenilitoris]